jgi:hypothetical protein
MDCPQGIAFCGPSTNAIRLLFFDVFLKIVNQMFRKVTIRQIPEMIIVEFRSVPRLM